MIWQANIWPGTEPSLGGLQVKLLAKIEELTLHMFDADAWVKRLEERNRELQEKNTRLENARPVSAR